MKATKKGMAMGGMTPASKKPTSTKVPMGMKNPRGMGLGPNDRPMVIKPTIEPKPKAGYMAKGGMVKKGGK